MWNRNLKAQLISNNIIADIESSLDHGFEESFFTNTIKLLKKNFPSLSEPEIIDLLDIVINVYNSKHSNKVELVATLPLQYKVQALPTISVINDLVDNAQGLIMITGYSISDYAEDLLMKIINKSRSGVMVKMFVNSFDTKESTLIQKLDIYRGRYLEIYRYENNDDKMAALHAKIVSADNCRTLVTSANLSFHGLEGNIELGCYTDSHDYGSRLHDLFSELIKQKKVKKVY